jgi:hypothetical protein
LYASQFRSRANNIYSRAANREHQSLFETLAKRAR